RENSDVAGIFAHQHRLGRRCSGADTRGGLGCHRAIPGNWGVQSLLNVVDGRFKAFDAGTAGRSARYRFEWWVDQLVERGDLMARKATASKKASSRARKPAIRSTKASARRTTSSRGGRRW